MGDDSGLGLRIGAEQFRDVVSAASNYPASNGHETSNVEATIESYEHDEVNDEEYDESEVPVISIELERLVGYKPSNTDEIDSIKSQLIDAMWMRYKKARQTENNKQSEKTKEASEEEQQQRQDGGPPPDFDDQIKELLDSRVARFGVVNSDADETTETKNIDDGPSPSPFLEIPYPSRILLPRNNASSDNDRPRMGDTAKMLSDIRSLSCALDDPDDPNQPEYGVYHPHRDTVFLYHLADHLECTGRLLSWKHSMYLELKDILSREILREKHGLWVEEQRAAKLEQLYQVRETLVHSKEVAKDDFDKLVSIKETAIRKDMILYDHSLKRNKRNNNNGSSLLGGGELSFPEEFELMGLLPKDSQLYEEEDWGGTLDDDDDIDYYNSEYSDYSDSGSNSDSNSNSDLSGFGGDEEGGDDQEETDSPLLPIGSGNEKRSIDAAPPASPPTADIPDDNLKIIGRDTSTTLGITSVPKPFLRRNKQRRKKKARAKKKKELAEAQRREEQKQRRKHEAFVEAKQTTNELVLAQTLMEALNKKVEDVEELLENLQDEEWQAAEAEEADTETHDQKQQEQTKKNNDSKKKEEGLSLLDQILAMVLGALPMTPGREKESHFLYIKDEHDFIVYGWKEYFGRLPPAHVPGQTSNHNISNSDTSNNANHNSPVGHAVDGKEGSPVEGTNHKPKTNIGFSVPPSFSNAKLSKITSKKSSLAGTASATVATKATPQEQRMALGIVDNEDCDWDTLAEE